MKTQAYTLCLGLLISICANADRVNATYMVPASPDGSPLATYPLTNLSLAKNAENLRTLTFSLPEDLIGPQAAPLVLTETVSPSPNKLQLVGRGVSALCTHDTDTKQVSCPLVYAPGYFQIDQKKVSDFLNMKYAGQTSLISEKLAASTHFANDPEGVVTFSLLMPIR